MSKRKPSKSKSKAKAPKEKTIAECADRHSLYEQSVQAPKAEVRFFGKAYRHAYNAKPLVLREDFCGTAAVAAKWVASDSERVAYGVDLDPDPLCWGAEHNVGKLTASAKERIELIEGDVRQVKCPAADVLAAQNFSFFIFKRREELIDYFRTARHNLAKKGVLVLDMFGGPDSITEDQQETRRIGDFEYVWEQHRFDPITHDCTFHIHFRFPEDESELKRAFTYKWRWWSIPEVREMLAEAGFARSEVYWEGTDKKTNEGNGVYKRRKSAPSDPAWVCYLVGVK